jgi:hypothetical protein
MASQQPTLYSGLLKINVATWRGSRVREVEQSWFPRVNRKCDFVMSTTQVPTARVQKHGFLADVFMSRNSNGSIFHYIIQRTGATEILYWGQEHSLKEALERIQEYLAKAESRVSGF